MCRFAVYRGQPITLKKLIFDSPHNFIVQSRQPKEMVITPINGDGYGVGWYNLDVHSEPAILKSDKPFWNDSNVVRIADKITASNIFMHIRAASPGLPVHEANSHPFYWKNEMFMHNGLISDFRKGMMRGMRQLMTDFFYSNLLGTTDSEHIFALYLTIRHENPKFTMREAFLETIDRLNFLAKKHESDLILNMSITDGKETLVTKYTSIDKVATLYFAENLSMFPNAVIAASEPLDHRDKAWQSFPVNHLMVINEKNEFTFESIPNPFVSNGVFPQPKPVTLKVSSPTDVA
jgi:glutamine amidotransferase